MRADPEYQWVEDKIRNNEVSFSEHIVRDLLGRRVSLPGILSVLTSGAVIEVHTNPRRKPFHVAVGHEYGKPLHVVFSGSGERGLAVLIAYEPTLPQWMDPRTRSKGRDGQMQHNEGRCFFCGGVVEPIVVGNFDYRLDGQLHVLKDVPAGLCLQCGEKYISVETARKIDELIATQHPDEQETVSVLRFPLS